MQEQNDAIFRQLEEAMTVSVEPLDKMFRAAGMDPDRMHCNQVRSGYSGQGGPLTPLSFSTRGEETNPDTHARQPHPGPDGPAEPLPHRRAEGALCDPAEDPRSASPALAIGATQDRRAADA